MRNLLKGPLALLRAFRQYDEVAPLLPTRRIPEQAEELLRGKTGRPHELFGELRSIAPRNVLNLLYGDIMRANPKASLKGEEFARSFNAPKFKWENPLGRILPSDYVSANLTSGGDDLTERIIRGFDPNISDAAIPHFNLDRVYDNDASFRKYFNENYLQSARDLIPKPILRRPYRGFQAGPEGNYFERALTSDDPLLMQLPDEAFKNLHFDARRPHIGHVRGTHFGNTPQFTGVTIDEIQSDLAPRIAELRYDPAFKSMKTPASLEGIYGRLAGGALQQAVKGGSRMFEMITPETARIIRGISPDDLYNMKRSIENSARRHGETPDVIKSRELLDSMTSNANKIDRIYGDTLQKEFYEPMQREFGLKPYKQYNEVLLEGDDAVTELPYNSLTLSPDIIRQIISKGIPGFRQGGLRSLS